MEARSTNAKGFVHYGGDVVAGVEDGVAVHLRSASTGGTAIIEPLTDSDTAALTVRAKGAAVLTFGNTSNAVAITGSSVAITGNMRFGTGTEVIKGIYSTNSTWSLGAVSSQATAELTFSTETSTGFSFIKGDIVTYYLEGHTGTVMMGHRFSTVGTSMLTVIMGNNSSVASTASSGTITVSWIDIT